MEQREWKSGTSDAERVEQRWWNSRTFDGGTMEHLTVEPGKSDVGTVEYMMVEQWNIIRVKLIIQLRGNKGNGFMITVTNIETLSDH